VFWENVALTTGILAEVSEKFAVFIRTAKFENVGWKIFRNASNLLPTNMLLSEPL
jgi:hypothetical protein